MSKKLAAVAISSLILAATPSGVHAAGAEAEEVITGKAFRFEIDGEPIPPVSCEPGAFRCELQDATMGSRADNHKDFTATKPQFGACTADKAKTNKTTGEDQFVLTDPGDIEFSEVEVVGPFVSGGSRAELLQWIAKWRD